MQTQCGDECFSIRVKTELTSFFNLLFQKLLERLIKKLLDLGIWKVLLTLMNFRRRVKNICISKISELHDNECRESWFFKKKLFFSIFL